MKRLFRTILVVYFAFLIISWNVVAWAQSDTIFLPVIANAAADDVKVPPTPTPSIDQQVVDILLTESKIANWLEQNPGWQSNVYQTDEGENIWQADFCVGEDCNEWIGYGQVNLNTGEVVNYFVPSPLSPEEFAAGKEKIEKYLLYDPEVQARLGNPDLWYHETDWNRWDQIWEASYSYGLDTFTVRLYINADTGKVEFDSVVNNNEMDEETAERERMDRARQLIWEAEGVGEAIDGHDNVKTYVEHQHDTLYTVAFAEEGQQLFSALIDIETGTILESGN